ncbi:flocculation protein FLO11-like [Diprion similis]|uniref:flocculation protein FLO11-like n=1 Tax=Diprion similis TaxID=362088 RepID=UPI001EF827F9|nr:flocculation protein FLO11-like [Diprion similis]
MQARITHGYFITVALFLACCWVNSNDAIPHRRHSHPQKEVSHRVNHRSATDGTSLSRDEFGRLDEKRDRKSVPTGGGHKSSSSKKARHLRSKTSNINVNVNKNIMSYLPRIEKHSTQLEHPVSEFPLTMLEPLAEQVKNCTNSYNSNDRNSSIFNVNSTSELINVGDEFQVAGETGTKRTTSVHVGVNITLCWIETTTIKEDHHTQPVQRQVVREYTISFENSATTPEQYLELEGEVDSTNSSFPKSALFKVVDENTRHSYVVNFTRVSHTNDLTVWQHKRVQCGVGPVVTTNIIVWAEEHVLKKRVEIKVSPNVHRLTAIPVETESYTADSKDWGVTSTTTFPLIQDCGPGSTCESYGDCADEDCGSSSTSEVGVTDDLLQEQSTTAYTLTTRSGSLESDNPSTTSTKDSTTMVSTAYNLDCGPGSSCESYSDCVNEDCSSSPTPEVDVTDDLQQQQSTTTYIPPTSSGNLESETPSTTATEDSTITVSIKYDPDCRPGSSCESYSDCVDEDCSSSLTSEVDVTDDLPQQQSTTAYIPTTRSDNLESETPSTTSTEDSTTTVSVTYNPDCGPGSSCESYSDCTDEDCGLSSTSEVGVNDDLQQEQSTTAYTSTTRSGSSESENTSTTSTKDSTTMVSITYNQDCGPGSTCESHSDCADEDCGSSSTSEVGVTDDLQQQQSTTAYIPSTTPGKLESETPLTTSTEDSTTMISITYNQDCGPGSSCESYSDCVDEDCGSSSTSEVGVTEDLHQKQSTTTYTLPTPTGNLESETLLTATTEDSTTMVSIAYNEHETSNYFSPLVSETSTLITDQPTDFSEVTTASLSSIYDISNEGHDYSTPTSLQESTTSTVSHVKSPQSTEDVTVLSMTTDYYIEHSVETDDQTVDSTPVHDDSYFSSTESDEISESNVSDGTTMAYESEGSSVSLIPSERTTVSWEYETSIETGTRKDGQQTDIEQVTVTLTPNNGSTHITESDIDDSGEYLGEENVVSTTKADETNNVNEYLPSGTTVGLPDFESTSTKTTETDILGTGSTETGEITEVTMTDRMITGSTDNYSTKTEIPEDDTPVVWSVDSSTAITQMKESETSTAGSTESNTTVTETDRPGNDFTSSNPTEDDSNIATTESTASSDEFTEATTNMTSSADVVTSAQCDSSSENCIQLINSTVVTTMTGSIEESTGTMMMVTDHAIERNKTTTDHNLSETGSTDAHTTIIGDHELDATSVTTSTEFTSTAITTDEVTDISNELDSSTKAFGGLEFDATSVSMSTGFTSTVTSEGVTNGLMESETNTTEASVHELNATSVTVLTEFTSTVTTTEEVTIELNELNSGTTVGGAHEFNTMETSNIQPSTTPCTNGENCHSTLSSDCDPISGECKTIELNETTATALPPCDSDSENCDHTRKSTTNSTSIMTINNEPTIDPKQHHILGLKIKILLEHVDDNDETQKLVEVDKHLLFNEQADEEGEQTLLNQVVALDNNISIQTIQELLNCSTLANFTGDLSNTAAEYLAMHDGVKNITVSDSGNSDGRRKSNASSMSEREMDPNLNMTLPEIVDDIHAGLNYLITKIPSNRAMENQSRKMIEHEIPRSDILKLISNPQDYRTNNDRVKRNMGIEDVAINGKDMPKDFQEVGHWSNERVRRGLNSGHVRTLTEFTIYKGPEAQ